MDINSKHSGSYYRIVSVGSKGSQERETMRLHATTARIVFDTARDAEVGHIIINIYIYVFVVYNTILYHTDTLPANAHKT